MSMYKLNNELSPELFPDSFYFVKTGPGFDTYLTSKDLVAIPYKPNSSFLIDEHIEPSNDLAHELASVNRNGFMSKSQFLQHRVMDETRPYLYKNDTLINKQVKIWTGEITSDTNGDFYVDWTRAGFTEPPYHVSVTAVDTKEKVTDRSWATMQDQSLVTTTGGWGYTIKGQIIAAVVVGGGPSVRVAPEKLVKVMAVGV